MANSKDLMGLSENELIGLGAQYGLTFRTGMKKSHMVQQLSQSAASGWMETNSQLMHESPDEDYSHMIGFGGDSSMLSDAAHVAQLLSGAGYTETFHNAMGSGSTYEVDALSALTQGLGADVNDVWMHMPQANANAHAQPFHRLKEHLRDLSTGSQDIMPHMAGHYSGDILGEYSTNLGGLTASYEHFAHMYVDRSRYDNAAQYQHDISKVAQRLAIGAGPRFNEVAAASAMGAPTSYLAALPQIGDSSIVNGIAFAREPLNAAGLPMGATGSAVGGRDYYSLTASLSGMPEGHATSKALFSQLTDAARSLGHVYTGGSNVGMNPYGVETDERSMILDSATRYVDIESARSGYANLDDPTYSAAAIRAVIGNSYDQMESGVSQSFDPASAARTMHSTPSTGTDFSASIGQPSSWNSARDRREAIAIANLDASVASAVEEDAGTGGVQYHQAFEQGSKEWHDFRNKYDITGSTVGSYLGNNRYTSPVKEMSDKIGLGSPRTMNADMARGHRLEPVARGRVAGEIGQSISEVGAITNDTYPGMMYSPDGLIGSDAIWEHKAPRKFFDLEEHPDYMDQMQLGMMLSGRSRALFSQTVGSETRSEWIDQDPSWYARNRNKINSSMARMDAGRRFMEENSDLEADQIKAGARSAMSGDGIWGFRNNSSGSDYYTGGRRGMSRYSSDAGTDADPFLAGSGSTSGTPSSSMALAVKEGILSAQEENRQKSGSLSSDSGGGMSLPGPGATDEERSAAMNEMLRQAGYGGGSGGSGGGGGGRNGGFFGDADPSKMWDNIRAGITGGSLRSAQNGFMNALQEGGPIGQSAALAIGAFGVGGDLLSSMSDYRGVAEDYGSLNAIHYDSMSQGMEMLGLNEAQARSVNATTHSVYNTMQNGDPTGATRLVVASRGLVTLADINNTQGDPVALNRIFTERARERGWSQARIAGAAQMMGLDGFARGATRGETTRNAAEGLVDTREREDVSDFNYDSERGQAVRAAASPTYFAPRYTAEASNVIMAPITGTMASAYNGFEPVASGAATGANSSLSETMEWIGGKESGNREYNADGSRVTSPTGARGRYQVLPSTARDPGYGIKPSNGTPEDDARLARDVYSKLLELNDGDSRKAHAAYANGQGSVERAEKSANLSGGSWEQYLPKQAQNRVKAWDEHVAESQIGAGGFTRNGVSYGQTPTTINVEIKANVNNQTANATATVAGGQTVTQQINMNQGAAMRR